MGLQDSIEIETTSLEKLNKLLTEANDEKIRKRLQHHVEETNEQLHRISRRMQELNIPAPQQKAVAQDIELPRSGTTNTVTTTNAAGGTVTTTTGKNLFEPWRSNDFIKNGYAYENFEIAHYEFLKEESDRIGDHETKKVAEHNLKEEEDFVDEIKDMIPDIVKRELPS